MSRYFFHLHDRAGKVVDPEGRALESVASARNHAVTAARAVISDDVLTGVLDLSGYIEVTDELGGMVMVVHFEEAVLRVI
jgi:hypothetical protein